MVGLCRGIKTEHVIRIIGITGIKDIHKIPCIPRLLIQVDFGNSDLIHDASANDAEIDIDVVPRTGEIGVGIADIIARFS